MGDALEEVREPRIHVAQHARGLVRLGRQDERVGLVGGPARGGDPPPSVLARHAGDALLQAHRPRGEPRGERLDELLHAPGEGHEERPAGPARPRVLRRGLPGRAPEGQDHAPLAPLHLEEARHGRRQRQLVGIRGVDARDQRLGDALERLAAEPPPHERAEALVGIAAARQHQVARHPELARPGEEPRGEQRRQAGRRQQLEALGQRMQAAAPDHEGAAEAIVGADQPLLQAEPPAQGERPRLLGQERIGPALDEKAVALLGLDGAAHPVRALEHGQLERPPLLPRALDRAVGRGQPGDPRADDDEPHRVRARSTRSASIAMKSGWSLAAGARWKATPAASATRRASTSRS